MQGMLTNRGRAWCSRCLPEILAALVLAWFLRSSPAVFRRHVEIIRETLPQLRDLEYRIPPARAKELKGAFPAIRWVNENVPRDEPLLYVGSMSRGIRLRYYTLPREARWHYVYGSRDLKRVPDIFTELRPAWILAEMSGDVGQLELPAGWQPVWSDPPGLMRVFKVEGDSFE